MKPTNIADAIARVQAAETAHQGHLSLYRAALLLDDAKSAEFARTNALAAGEALLDAIAMQVALQINNLRRNLG